MEINENIFYKNITTVLFFIVYHVILLKPSIKIYLLSLRWFSVFLTYIYNNNTSNITSQILISKKIWAPCIFILTYLFRGLNCLCYFNAFCNNRSMTVFTVCQITTYCCSDIYQEHILFKNIRGNGVNNIYATERHLRLYFHSK